MSDAINLYHANALAAVGLVFLHFAYARLFRPRSRRQSLFFVYLGVGWLANLVYLEFLDISSNLGLENPLIVNLGVRSINTVSYALFLVAARTRLADYLAGLPSIRTLLSISLVVFGLPFAALFSSAHYLVLSIPGVLLGIAAIAGVGLSYHVHFRRTTEHYSNTTKMFVSLPLYLYSGIQFGVFITPPYYSTSEAFDARLLGILFVLGMILKALHIVGLISLGESVFSEYREQIRLLGRARLSVALADQLAHELNTPAAELKLRLDHFTGGVDGAEGRSRVVSLIEQITGLLKSFEVFQRDQRIDRVPGGKVKTVNLNNVCDAVVMSLKLTLRPDCKIEKDYESGPIVQGVESELHQIIRNIVKNAVESVEEATSGEGDVPTVSISTVVSRKNQTASLIVVDNGLGIPSQIEETLFEDGVTTKGGVGRGHGLHIVESLVRKHLGAVKARSLREGNGRVIGARFEIELPLATKMD